ncbi:MAG: hypothetical protein ACQPRI_06085 [Solitalea-like symbiont of Tyrophagus putrescentiae]
MGYKNHGNHNNYRGPLLAMINLSQVTAINALHFEVIDLPEERWGGPFTGLRELTIKASRDLTETEMWATDAGADVLRRLTALTINLGCFRQLGDALPAATTTTVGAGLRRLSLQRVLWPLTELVQQLVVPLTTTTTSKVEKGVTIINDRLEELRVAWWCHIRSSIHVSRVKTEGVLFSVRFPALTTLHLVKSNLLHR